RVILAQVAQQLRRARLADALPALLRYRMKLLRAEKLPAERGRRLESIGGRILGSAAPEHAARDRRRGFLLLRAILVERILVVPSAERRVVQIARDARDDRLIPEHRQHHLAQLERLQVLGRAERSEE